MITPIFDLEKSLQALLYIASKIDGVGTLQLFKILYFADRDHVSEYGRTITGDTYIAMKNGPVPSNIFDVIKVVRGDSSSIIYRKFEQQFKESFDIIEGYIITPKISADLDYLSESDVEMIDKSIKKYGKMGFSELSEISHQLAWKSTGENQPMSLDLIMKENKDSDEFIDVVSEQLKFQHACMCL